MTEYIHSILFNIGMIAFSAICAAVVWGTCEAKTKAEGINVACGAFIFYVIIMIWLMWIIK